MGLFNKKNNIMDVIRCDEPSYLIWKWHPKNDNLGENKRENSIRWGSTLRVKDGEAAVFVYKQNNEMMQEYIVGPFDETLKTKNLPILSSIIGLAYGGDTPFQAEVYFINLATIIQTKFAVPFFDVYDPRFLDFGVPVSMRGTISFKIKDCDAFIKLHRLIDFKLEDFQNQIKDSITRYSKSVLTSVVATSNIPLVQIETQTSLINEKLESDISQRLEESFGVCVTGVDVGSIELDKDSEGYKQLMSVTRDITSATIKAETEAKIKNISDKQKIDIQNYGESLRIQREEAQYAQHKQTQTSNMGAFQVEKQAEVGVASAEALGKMGSNGAGSVNVGGGGTGFNPAAMMTSMAVGSVVGQNIAGTMNGILSNNANANNMTPPPVPLNEYYVADNGQKTGPYDIEFLKKMINEGKLKKETLVWKSGMANWEKAGSVEEINNLFIDIPPIPKN